MGVARCPFADQVGRGRPKLWNPDAEHDPRGTPGGAIVPRCVIVHSEATKGLARPGGNGLEWHFMVRRDGRILQHVDTARRADANNKANAFAVSIETEDDGDPDREPWTDAQLWALERLIRWVCTVHRIPLRRCPSWSAAGVGYHTMWGAPSPWTPVAKTCPGRVRIRQFDEVLMPRLAGSPSTDSPTGEDFLVAAFDRLDVLKGECRKLFRVYLDRNPNDQRELDLHILAMAREGYEARVIAFAESAEGKAVLARQRELLAG